MRESQLSKQIETRGKHLGELERARADMLRVLQAHLKSAAPEPIRLAIEGTNDLGTLDRWFDEALTATSWAQFEAAMKQG